MPIRSDSDYRDRKLMAWAAWVSAGGRGDGYPMTSPLHRSWMPAAAGSAQRQCAGGRSYAEEKMLHDRIRRLPTRLSDALMVVYVKRARPEDQARTLGCAESTVRARVAQAKGLLWG